jgi:hypothetical protein
MRRLLVLLSAIVFLSCSTVSRDVVTPFGSRPGDQVGPFVILGILHRSTSTENRPDGHAQFSENVDVNVPPGTELIIPVVRGYQLGYGTIDPPDFTTSADRQSFTWHPDDHHFGVAALNVSVDRINAVDNSTTPPTQTARVVVDGKLADVNGDDRWWGSVNYTLLCLGRQR